MNNEKITAPSSEISASLAENIRMLMLGTPYDNLQVAKPATIQEWRVFCKEYLHAVEKPIDDGQIKRALDHFAETLKGPEVFNVMSGALCCATIIPCDTNGYKYDTDELQAGEHIIFLYIFDPESKSNPPTETQKIFDTHKLLYDILPPEIKDQCSFYIEQPLEAELILQDSPSTNQKAVILTRCARALVNLQALLR